MCSAGCNIKILLYKARLHAGIYGESKEKPCTLASSNKHLPEKIIFNHCLCNKRSFLTLSVSKQQWRNNLCKQFLFLILDADVLSFYFIWSVLWGTPKEGKNIFRKLLISIKQNLSKKVCFFNHKETLKIKMWMKNRIGKMITKKVKVGMKNENETHFFHCSCRYYKVWVGNEKMKPKRPKWKTIKLFFVKCNVFIFLSY